MRGHAADLTEQGVGDRARIDHPRPGRCADPGAGWVAGEVRVQQIPAGEQLVGGAREMPGGRVGLTAAIVLRRCSGAQDLRLSGAARSAHPAPCGGLGTGRRRRWLVELPGERHVPEIAGQGGDYAVGGPEYPVQSLGRQVFLDGDRGGDVAAGLGEEITEDRRHRHHGPSAGGSAAPRLRLPRTLRDRRPVTRLRLPGKDSLPRVRRGGPGWS